MSDWRTWIMDPPRLGQYEVIEWMRGPAGIWPEDHEHECEVARLDDLLDPRNGAWNVAGVYWRPVL